MGATREQVITALAALFAVPGPGVALGFCFSGRKIKMFDKIGLDKQPAIFVAEMHDDVMREPRGLTRRMIMNVQLNVFARVPDQDTDGAPTINTLLDAVEGAFAPDAQGLPWNACTLGGLVQRVWIEGQIRKNPGDLNGQAYASVPVKILVP